MRKEEKLRQQEQLKAEKKRIKGEAIAEKARESFRQTHIAVYSRPIYRPT